MRRLPDVPSIDDVRSSLIHSGAIRVGVVAATELSRARTALYERREAGYADSMQFTYRNPERSTDPFRAVPGARSIIVAAYPCDGDDETRPSGVPARVARYARHDHYGPLREALSSLARTFKASGHKAVALVDDNAIVDREVAYLAGVGWFGRNANLLVPGAGSHVVLGSVITTVEYPVDRPVPDGCGSCTRCITDCPTEAIVAPGVIDARRCLAWILQRPGSLPEEFREAVGDRIYGCDDCQESCPPTVRLSLRHRRPAERPGSGEWVDSWWFLEATDESILNRHGQWYIHKRDPRWLRRNALVVIGNTADPADAAVRARLEPYRTSPDEMIAEHANWASHRLDQRATVESP